MTGCDRAAREPCLLLRKAKGPPQKAPALELCYGKPRYMRAQLTKGLVG